MCMYTLFVRLQQPAVSSPFTTLSSPQMDTPPFAMSTNADGESKKAKVEQQQPSSIIPQGLMLGHAQTYNSALMYPMMTGMLSGTPGHAPQGAIMNESRTRNLHSLSFANSSSSRLYYQPIHTVGRWWMATE